MAIFILLNLVTSKDALLYLCEIHINMHIHTYVKAGICLNKNSVRKSSQNNEILKRLNTDMFFRYLYFYTAKMEFIAVIN